MAILRKLDSVFHDDGLVHNHSWGSDPHRSGGLRPQGLVPTVAEPGVATTPSSARHDDLHYGL